MSTINAASTGQVRYVASLAMRCGQLPALVNVQQPTLSLAQFSQVKNGLTVQIGKAIVSQRNAPVAPHQAKLVSAMAHVSGVQVPALSSRQQADQVAVNWFRRNPAQVQQLIQLLNG